MLNRMKNSLKILVLNIHTILLFVGIAFIVVAAFLLHEILGYFVLGISFILVSKLIDNSM